MRLPQPTQPPARAATAVTPCDLVIIVEDPGAANYVAGLPRSLAASGVLVQLVASGFAESQLCALGIAHHKLPAGQSGAELLQALRPKLVVVGTSEATDALGLAVIDAARESGIASIGVIDGAANPELRFRGRSADAMAHAPDRLLVADQATRSAYVACGFRPEHVHVCGHPHFDAVRQTRALLAAEDRTALRERLFPGAGDRPVILFLAEVSDGLDPTLYRRRPDYTLVGDGGSDRRTLIVLDEFITACELAHPDAFTVLRLHPKDRRDEYAAYIPRFADVSAGGPVAPLLYAADLVVGMTSIALVEATLLGRPTLSILPRPGEAEWLPTIASGVTPMVCRRSGIAPALRALIGARVDDEHVDALMPPGANARVCAVLRDLMAAQART